VAENEENNKIGELKQITKKQKKSHYDNMIMGNNPNFVNSMNNVNFMQNIDKNVHYDMPLNYGLANNNLNMNMQMPLGFGMMGSRPNRHFDLMENNSRPLAMKSMAAPNYSAKKCKKAKRSSPLMEAKEIRYEKSKRMEEDNEYLGNNFEAGDDDGDIEYDMMKESNANEDRYEEGDALKINLGKNDEEEEKEVKKESEKEEKKEEKKVEFSNKELVLTQDIFDGCWNLNPQTQLLIEKEKSVYDKIEQILKEKNIEKEEVKITMLVLYYLNTNDSINKVEYMLIIKKGISFLEENGIKFDEVLPSLKN
jgi:Icc-related predicted phosphoesterase